MTLFTDLDLSPGMLASIRALKFEEASPIQAQAIPELMQGHDMIGQAQTGTGKTAAFAIPIIERLDMPKRHVQAIILCPTRELALQVGVQLNKLMLHAPKMGVVTLYGGDPVPKQLRAMQQKRPRVVVGTPGRVLDFIRRGVLKLDQVKFAVLDEADEMLDMGFRKDIEAILNETPRSRQTMLFSATMSHEIRNLANYHLTEPKFIKTANDNQSSANIEQFYLQVSGKRKQVALNALIASEDINHALIFCNTKRQVDYLTDVMHQDGHAAEGLHGGLSQSKRDRVMRGFRGGRVKYLVATDVAARGIDVKNIEAVFNYDFPQTLESYVHRIGRTGRADKNGKAFTFIRPNEVGEMKRIERITKSNVTRLDVPPPAPPKRIEHENGERVEAPRPQMAPRPERQPRGERTYGDRPNRERGDRRSANRPDLRNEGRSEARSESRSDRPAFRRDDRHDASRSNRRSVEGRRPPRRYEAEDSMSFRRYEGRSEARSESRSDRPYKKRSDAKEGGYNRGFRKEGRSEGRRHEFKKSDRPSPGKSGRPSEGSDSTFESPFQKFFGPSVTHSEPKKSKRGSGKNDGGGFKAKRSASNADGSASRPKKGKGRSNAHRKGKPMMSSSD